MRYAVLFGLVGCFAPNPNAGLPCGPGDVCPSGQTCRAGLCNGPEPTNDAPIADVPAIDAPASDAEVDAFTLGPWSTPTPIPGVNSASAEGDPSLTADRLTIVFGSNRSGNEDIFIGTRAAIGDAFTVSALAAANTASIERSPEISADGNTLLFTSDRGGNLDIYISTKVNGTFGAPAIVAELSTTADEGDVAVSPDGLTALVARNNDLFITTRGTTASAWATPVIVPELDITGNVAAPSLTDGANAVYLHAGTTRDLYVAYRQGQGFTTPVPITELNTAGRDAAPFVSADERYLAFERAGQLLETTR